MAEILPIGSVIEDTGFNEQYNLLSFSLLKLTDTPDTAQPFAALQVIFAPFVAFTTFAPETYACFFIPVAKLVLLLPFNPVTVRLESGLEYGNTFTVDA